MCLLNPQAHWQTDSTEILRFSTEDLSITSMPFLLSGFRRLLRDTLWLARSAWRSSRTSPMVLPGWPIIGKNTAYIIQWRLQGPETLV